MKQEFVKKGLAIIATLMASLTAIQTVVVLAANTPTFSQTISDGTQSVDIVDANGDAVVSPGVTFGSTTFSFSYQTVTGTLGAASAKIRVFNPTADQTWTVSIAATSGATAVWSDGGSNTYDYNDSNTDGTDDADTDTKGGRLTVDPAAGTLAGVSGCATTNVTKGSSSSFREVAVAVNSITLLTGAAGAATYCRWDLTGVGLSQIVPASQAPAVYTLNFTITIA